MPLKELCINFSATLSSQMYIMHTQCVCTCVRVCAHVWVCVHVQVCVHTNLDGFYWLCQYLKHSYRDGGWKVGSEVAG